VDYVAFVFIPPRNGAADGLATDNVDVIITCQVIIVVL